MSVFRAIQLLVPLAAIACSQRVATAGVIYTSNPQGSWRYSFQQGGPGDADPSYFSTSLSDVASASYRGFVVYNYIESGPRMGGFGPEYGEPGSTYHVFSTFVTSKHDQSIRLNLAGDDGHSLFVNGSFVTGAGFGGTADSPNAFYDLSLIAGVPVKMTMVGHDAYGSSWVFGITDPESYRGVTISAIVPLPEPDSAALLAIASAWYAGCQVCRFPRKRTL